MNIQGAVFDMDGTLVESLTFWQFLWEHIGERYFRDPSFRPSDSIDRSCRTMIYEDGMRLFTEHYPISEDFPIFMERAYQWIETYYHEYVLAKPGAAELLDALKRHGVRMCLATATEPKYVRYLLKKLDFGKYFDFALSCSEVGAGKDKPDIYLEAAKQLALPTENLAVFEDSYVALETAGRIGFHTIGIYDPNNYGHDRLKSASEIYMDRGETLSDLIGRIYR